MNSIFETQNTKKYKSLNQNLSADILIIGGGLSGLLLAHKLSKNNLKVTLIEKKTLGNMASIHNTGKVSYLQNDLMDIPVKVAKKHLKNQYETLHKFKNFIIENQIECELKEVKSHLFSKNNSLLKIKKILEELKIDHRWSEKKFSGEIYSLLTVYEEFTINPALLVKNMQKSFQIYEETPIQKIDYSEKKVITVDKNEIYYKTLILCSNFPFMKFKKLLGFRLYSEKSYLIAFSSSTESKDNFIELENSGISLRQYQDINIICGNDHKLGARLSKNPYDKLSDFMKQYFHFSKEINRWFNIDTITFDKLPLIGWFCSNIYLATGYNKWGLNTAYLASDIISSMLLDNISHNRNNIYNPNRSFFLRAPFKMIKNTGRNAYFLMSTIFTNKRCSHLGCRLKYNPFTDTYDCPCHGSCFRNEKILFGPGYDQKN